MARPTSRSPFDGGLPPLGRHRRRALIDPALVLVTLGVVAIAFYRYQVAGSPISDWFFVGAALVILLNLLSGKASHYLPARFRRTESSLLVAVLVLLTAGTVSSFWSLNPFGSMVVVLRLAWVTLVWFWVIRTVCANRQALNYLVAGFKLAMLIAAAAAIAGWVGIVSFTDDQGNVYQTRQIGFTNHPNYLGAMLALGLLFFVLDTRTTPRRLDRQSSSYVRIGCLIFVSLGLMLTGSLSGLVGAATGVATIGLTRLAVNSPRRNRRRGEPLAALALVTLVVIGFGLLLTSNTPVVQRLTSLVEGDTATAASVSTRETYVNFVVDRFDEHLLVGVGLDTESAHFDSELEESGAGHSMPFKVIYQMGVPALIALLAISVLSLRYAWLLIMASRETELYGVAVVLFAAVVTVNVAAQVQPALAERIFWFPMALVSALWAMRRYELYAAATTGSANGR